MWKNKEEEEEEEEHGAKAVHLCRGSTHRSCEMETKFSHLEMCPRMPSVCQSKLDDFGGSSGIKRCLITTKKGVADIKNINSSHDVSNNLVQALPVEPVSASSPLPGAEWTQRALSRMRG